MSLRKEALILNAGTQADRRTDEATLLKLAKNKMKPVTREAAEKTAKEGNNSL